MSFSDTVFLFFLVLILFGPKKLPEIARQAGKLLAELRRASNEFKSQIETEINRLEVQKILPPSPPPQGTVSSLSAKPVASQPARPDSLETLATPSPEAAPLHASSVITNSAASTSAALSDSTATHEPTVEPSLPASQEPHV